MRWILLLFLLGNPVLAQDVWKQDGSLRLVDVGRGFVTPVGLAFLHKPGPHAKDPVFLVAELRGAVKAVTRDGSVMTIGELSHALKPVRDLPHFDGEGGQTGLCLTADDKWLYTTTVVPDGYARINKIVRWKSTGDTAWRVAKKDRELLTPFKSAAAGAAHQIGHCFIDTNQKLWVGVGDGHNPANSHMLSNTAGEILRLNLDLSAPTDNPFFEASASKEPGSYIWASGLRNPFALAFTRSGLTFVVDNGPATDRLLLLKRGFDYPWDGSDDSMTYSNLKTFAPDIGPSAAVYIEDDPLFPELNEHLVIAAAHIGSLLALPLSPEGQVKGPMRTLLEPTQKEPRQELTNVVRGPDGFYVARIIIDKEKGPQPGSLLKLVPSQGSSASEVISSPEETVRQANCYGCHQIGNEGSNHGPNLTNIAANLRGRLEDPAYLAQLKAYPAAAAATEEAQWEVVRRQLVEKKGSLAERMRLWLTSKVRHPSFADPYAKMPDLDLDQGATDRIVDWLLEETDRTPELTNWNYVNEKAKFYLSQNPRVIAVVCLLIGIILGVLGKAAVLLPWRLYRRFRGVSA